MSQAGSVWKQWRLKAVIFDSGECVFGEFALKIELLYLGYYIYWVAEWPIVFPAQLEWRAQRVPAAGWQGLYSVPRNGDRASLCTMSNVTMHNKRAPQQYSQQFWETLTSADFIGYKKMASSEKRKRLNEFLSNPIWWWDLNERIFAKLLRRRLLELTVIPMREGYREI